MTTEKETVILGNIVITPLLNARAMFQEALKTARLPHFDQELTKCVEILLSLQ